MAKVQFAMLNPNSAGFSFESYNNEDYNEVYFQTGFDKFQNPIKKRITFKNRVENFDENMKVPAHLCPLDEKGKPIQMSVVDFIRNSPFCLKEGEERLTIHRFKELNSKKAAQINNARAKEVFKAESIIHHADEQTIANLSALFGYLGIDKDMQFDTCLKACKVNPSEVIDAANNDSTEYRALLKELIDKRIVERKGTIIEYKAPRAAKAIVLGLDEDEAVVKLMKDKPLFASLKKQVK